MRSSHAMSIRDRIDEVIHEIKFWHSEIKKYPDDVKEVLALIRKAKKIVVKSI